jgi:hypothetical protein
MRRLLPALLSTLSLICFTTAQEAEPEKAPTWKEKAGEAGLNDAAIKQLERDGMLIADEPLRQAFSAYIEGELPTFITSDVVLNAFHVLFEESVKRLEEARAVELAALLKDMFEALPKALEKKIKGELDPVYKAAMPRARMMLAVALRLMGEKAELLEDQSKLVDAELKLIEAATGTGKPAWLGEPDKGFLAIDYARFKPLGFYNDNERLQRYYRANRWLQLIPFRVDRDEEFAAVLLIGWAFSAEGGGKSRDATRAAWMYDWFLGTGDDLGLYEAANLGRFFVLGIEDLRKDVPAGDAAINDQLRFIPDNPTEVAEVSFRLMPSYRLPDAVLFQRTTDPRKFKRAYPEGLEVAALLGNVPAREALPKEVVAEGERAAPLLGAQSMYCDYLRTLGHLNQPAEKEAPALFSSRAWQLKSCNTQLASWAQMRHTWVLQAKMNVYYLGLARVPAGFVEPNPDFWSALAGLCEETQARLGELGALRVSYAAIIEDCRALAKLLEDKKFVPYADDPEEAGLTEEELELLTRAAYTMALIELEGLRDIKDRDKLYKEFAKRLRDAADGIESGKPKSPEKLAEFMAENGADLEAMWEQLVALVRRIETLSHKQLRGVEFNESEQRFIKEIGETLAGCMFYSGNSWLTPRDDAARAAAIAANPQAGTTLHAAVGRPRVLYVLYPWKDELLLCRGAVLPYYEVQHSSPLTDAEWHERQAKAEAPEWLRPIIEQGRFSKHEPSDD